MTRNPSSVQAFVDAPPVHRSSTLWIDDSLTMAGVLIGGAAQAGVIDARREAWSGSSASATDWLYAVQIGLKELLLLPGNWNQEGAAPVADKAVGIAQTLIADFAASVPSLPRPAVYPTTDGGVVFEWESGGKHVDFEVTAAGSVELYYSTPEYGDFEGLREATPVPVAVLLVSLA